MEYNGGMQKEELIDLVTETVVALVREHPANRQPTTGEPIFTGPLIGCADGRDPLFEQYKEIIGRFHQTPGEVLDQAGIRETEEVSVVSWILPASEETRASNRLQNRLPSILWVHMRHHGEAFNDVVRKAVVEAIGETGAAAVAPTLQDSFAGMRRTRDDRIIGSNWSERHIAYAAGLGTFSLSDGLITPRGVAMRCGSVVTNAALAPTPRTAKNHTDHCLHFRNGTCGECRQRCPAGAISEKGHDKDRCRAYMHEVVEPAVQERYQVKATGCGFCQSGVPCEHGIPE